MDQLDPVNSSATFGTPYRHQLESSKPYVTILQKEVISTQKQPDFKKGAALFKMVSVKKVVKSKGAAKKYL